MSENNKVMNGHNRFTAKAVWEEIVESVKDIHLTYQPFNGDGELLQKQVRKPSGKSPDKLTRYSPVASKILHHNFPM